MARIKHYNDTTKKWEYADSSVGIEGPAGKDGIGIKNAVLNADYTLTLTFDDDTTYTTPSIRGPQGPAGTDGKDGTNGTNGKDGTNGTDGVGIASIKQTTTSSADGGANVFTVTLTNGTSATFTVKNGTKGTAGTNGTNGTNGKDGYTPIKGTDYWTAEDIEEIEDHVGTLVSSHNTSSNAHSDIRSIANQAKEESAEALETVGLVCEIAETEEECTDPNKLYRLPDGYIYAFEEKEEIVIDYTNVAGTITEGKRISASGGGIVDDTTEGTVVTDYFLVNRGDVIRFKGFDTTHANTRIGLFEVSDKSYVDLIQVNVKTAVFPVDSYGATNYIAFKNATTAGTVFEDTTGWPASQYYLVVSGIPNGDEIVVTINEEITEGELVTSYNLVKTDYTTVFGYYDNKLEEIEENVGTYQEDIVRLESDVDALKEETNSLDERVTSIEENGVISSDASDALPAYWESYLPERIDTIKSLQDQAGKESFTFIVMSDIHYPENLGKRSPAIAKRIMDECNIRYALVLGDLQSRGSHSTKALAESDFTGVKEMFEPIAENVLYQKGNHDGSWGSTLNGTTYPYNFTPEEMYNRIYAPVYKYRDVETDESGTGYYVDDKPNKVRYIMLNSHCNEYALKDDGGAKYNNMSNARFTQSQYDMLIEALSSMPEGWAALCAAHVPINNTYGEAFGDSTNATGDHVIMRNLLKAYKEKKTYSAEWAGTSSSGYDAVSVNADFSSAKGEFVGYFCGHMHDDYIYDAANWFGINIITTRCDGKQENDSTLNAERVEGTITEQCFDVFVVNRKNGTIYAVKIGAGGTSGGVTRSVIYKSVATTYTVTNTLTNATNNNSTSSIVGGSSYNATITANSGYTLTGATVKVTMGGNDITSTAYSNGKVTISNVTGNIVITVTAAEGIAYTNLFDPNGAGYVAWNGSKMYTNWMPYRDFANDSNGTIYHIKGWVASNSPYKFHFAYDTAGTFGDSTTGTALTYCTAASKKALVVSDYDDSVKLFQHHAGMYTTDKTSYIQFEFREDIAANLIITADEQIID